jgi:predicted transcriptional regulator
MKLYEITEALEAVLSGSFYVDSETAEYFDSTDLDALSMALTDKLEGCGCQLKNWQADIDALKAEETRLRERRQTLERRYESLKAYVQSQMEHAGETVETSKVSMKLRRSVTVEVAEGFSDARYLVRTETVKPDKKAIRDALKKGEFVEGAELVEHQNLQLK